MRAQPVLGCPECHGQCHERLSAEFPQAGALTTHDYLSHVPALADGLTGDRRGYSWPPFEPGHERSTVHGPRSPRRVEPLAAEIRAALLDSEQCPAHLHRAEFAAALSAWARAEAVVSLLWAYLAEQDIEAALGDVTTTDETEQRSKSRTTRRSTARRTVSALEQWRRHEAHAAALRRSLGLDPLGAGKLARDLSQSRWYAGATPLDRALDRIEAERQQAIEA